MNRALSTIVSLLVGILLGLAWIALLDGALWNASWKQGIVVRTYQMSIPHPRQPSYHWYYGVPAVLIAICMFALNLSSPQRLLGGDGDESDSRSTAVKTFVFLVITCAIMCLGGVAWVAVVNLGAPLPPIHGSHLPNEEEFSAWPGISLVVNACVQIVAGTLFFGALR